MKSILKTVSGVLLVAVIAVALVACSKQGNINTRQANVEITKQELIKKAVSAQEGVKTFQFDTNISSDMSGETSDGKFHMTMAYDMTGKVDRASKRMQTTGDMTMHVPQKEGGTPRSVKMEMTMYFIEDTMYMKMTGPGMPDQWIKRQMPGDYWKERRSQQIELFKDSQIKILGEEKVGNIECYVVDFVPSKEKMLEIIQQQWPGRIEQGKLDKTIKSMTKMIKSMTLKEWINKDTFLPVKEEAQVTMQMSPEAMNMPTPKVQKMEMRMDISTKYKAYNEPVSIELPKQAQNASEMPSGR